MVTAVVAKRCEVPVEVCGKMAFCVDLCKHFPVGLMGDIEEKFFLTYFVNLSHSVVQNGEISLCRCCADLSRWLMSVCFHSHVHPCLSHLDVCSRDDNGRNAL